MGELMNIRHAGLSKRSQQIFLYPDECVSSDGELNTFCKDCKANAIEQFEVYDCLAAKEGWSKIELKQLKGKISWYFKMQ